MESAIVFLCSSRDTDRFVRELLSSPLPGTELQCDGFQAVRCDVSGHQGGAKVVAYGQYPDVPS